MDDNIFPRIHLRTDSFSVRTMETTLYLPGHTCEQLKKIVVDNQLFHIGLLKISAIKFPDSADTANMMLECLRDIGVVVDCTSIFADNVVNMSILQTPILVIQCDSCVKCNPLANMLNTCRASALYLNETDHFGDVSSIINNHTNEHILEIFAKNRFGDPYRLIKTSQTIINNNNKCTLLSLCFSRLQKIES